MRYSCRLQVPEMLVECGEAMGMWGISFPAELGEMGVARRTALYEVRLARVERVDPDYRVCTVCAVKPYRLEATYVSVSSYLCFVPLQPTHTQ